MTISSIMTIVQSRTADMSLHKDGANNKPKIPFFFLLGDPGEKTFSHTSKYRVFLWRVKWYIVFLLEKLKNYQKSIVFHIAWKRQLTRQKKTFLEKEQMSIFFLFFVVIVINFSWVIHRNEFKERNCKFPHSLYHPRHFILKTKTIAF